MRPYTGELAFCAGVAYGLHGCTPCVQLERMEPLGSSHGAMPCKMVYNGCDKPRLVPVMHPVPTVGMLLDVATTPSYVKTVV